MKLSWLSVGALVVATLLAGSAYATDGDVLGESEPDATQTSVTTVGRAPIPAFTSDRSVDVADEADIMARQADDVGEALEQETGVMTQSTNRGARTVVLRGLTGPENLIYVDGVRFNQSTFRTGPNQYLNTIDPWAIERIEVARGPGSVLYGSGAMGGVIELIPRQVPTQQLVLRGLGNYKSADDTLGAGLDVGASMGRVAAYAGFSLREHGDLRAGQRGGQDLVVANEEDGVLLGTSYREMFWRTAVRTEITRNSSVRINYLGGGIDGATRTDRLGSGEVRVADNHDDLVYVTYEYKGFGLVDDLKWNVSFHRTTEDQTIFNCRTTDDGAGTISVANITACARTEHDVMQRRRHNQDAVQTLGSSTTAVKYIGPLMLTLGGDVYHDRVTTSERLTSTAPDFDVQPSQGNFAPDSTYSTVGVFVHSEYMLLSHDVHAVTINGGARVENFQATAPDISPEIGTVEFSNTGVVGSLGLSYLYGVNLNVYLNWSQGFRAPNLQEATVLGDTGNFYEVPNPDLGPERNNTFELGSKLALPGWGRLSGSTFVSLISDKIDRAEAQWEGQNEINGKLVQQRVNAGHAYYYGAELGLESAPVLHTRVFGNVAYLDGAVQAKAADEGFMPGPLHDLVAGDEFYTNPRRLSPVQYLAGFTFAPQAHWEASLYLQGALAQDKLAGGDLNDPRICAAAVGVLHKDLDQRCPGTAAWTTLNARAGYRHGDLARLDLAVTNLTDQRYRTHGSGVLAAGLQGMLTLVVNY